MQTRSVYERVADYARKLDTRALMGMVNAGICLHEQTQEQGRVCNAVTLLAAEGNVDAVSLLIEAFDFSILDAVFAAAFHHKTELVNHLISLSSESLRDSVRYKAVRGYLESGTESKVLGWLLGGHDFRNQDFCTENMIGHEKASKTDSWWMVDNILALKSRGNLDYFYYAIHQVMISAAILGNIERINGLNYSFWGGEVLSEQDAHYDIKFPGATSNVGIITGLTLGGHQTYIDEYYQYFWAEFPELIPALLLQEGVGLGLLGNLDLFAEHTEQLLAAPNEALARKLKVGFLLGLAMAYRIPSLLRGFLGAPKQPHLDEAKQSAKRQKITALPEVALLPGDHEKVIGDILDYYKSIKRREAINAIHDLLPKITTTQLDSYFEGCQLDEQHHICVTQNDEFARIVFLQAMNKISANTVFDVKDVTIRSLLYMNRINYYMQKYNLTQHQVKRLGQVFSEIPIAEIFLLMKQYSVLSLHLAVNIIKYLIIPPSPLVITQADLDPLADAIVDVAKARLSRCASRLFPGLQSQQPAFQPDLNNTKRLWEQGLERRKPVS